MKQMLAVMGLWTLAWGPGAAWAQPSLESIRVAVCRNDPEVTLQVYGRFTMTALEEGSGRVHEERRLASVAVRGVPQGLALGERILPYPGVRIVPASDAAVSINGKRLRGTLEIVRQKDLTLLVVNHVSVEDYLRGVLSKEAPDYWPEEALKAIAIAARTYALYQRTTKSLNLYDVTGDVMSQDYGGKTSERAGTTRAVKTTANWALLYQQQLFPAFYHSTCGGVTEHARVMGSYDLEPLQGGVACAWCTASPFFSWQRRLTKADLSWALRKQPGGYGAIGQVKDMRVTKRTPSGRVEELVIEGANRTVRLSGYDVRALLGFERVRSPLFTVAPDGPEAFRVQGHGWGHGVGLCQWGAAELARRGLSAPEILAVYYPRTELVRVQDIALTHAVTTGDLPDA